MKDKNLQWGRLSGCVQDYLKPGPVPSECGYPGDLEELVRKRRGAVLARHTILKSDHFDHRETGAGIKLLGGPNFRRSDLSIFGVAQPTSTGLYTVLTLLGAGPLNQDKHSCTWISTREEPLVYINDEPFVLRDRKHPAENLHAWAGISVGRLEQMEDRLKEDVLQEAMGNGGLVLVHDEREDSLIIPCFVSIESVKTSREVFEDLVARGYQVSYRRIPMSHGFSPMDPFVDELIDIFQQVPLEHSVVFSCGLGIGRTTFGMLVGLLLRRFLVCQRTGKCPFAQPVCAKRGHRDVLRLIGTLEKALGDVQNLPLNTNANAPHHLASQHHQQEQQQSALQWILERDGLLEDLTEALHGNYKCILDLVRVLGDGIVCKRIADEAIDRCQAFINLREAILIYRVRHAVRPEQAIDAATCSMERYFALIVLCGFMTEVTKNDAAGGPANASFTQWVHSRPEIWNMFSGLRKNHNKLKLFLPINKLSGIPKAGVIPAGEEALSEDAAIEASVIRGRAGSVLVPHTILKSDLWFAEYRLPSVVDGAENLRQIPKFPVYAVAQPRADGIKAILTRLTEGISAGDHLCWITIREEPLVMIHGEPYVLRDRFGSLRNLRSYSGIKAGRLEQMELRLKEDCWAEAQQYSKTLLVHTEDTDGNIFSIWEKIESPEDITTLAQLFGDLASQLDGPALHYYRIPVTAEDAPEPVDFDHIKDIICAWPIDHLRLIFNCQIGAGRSTTGTVMACQVIHWLRREKAADVNTVMEIDERSVKVRSDTSDRGHYKAVHSILRTIRFGLETKAQVDRIIDSAAAVVNLRNQIDEWRNRAKMATDPAEVRRSLRKGLAALKRYCLLLLFQAYLDETEPDADPQLLESFVAYLARHPEFERILSELEQSQKLETLEPEAMALGKGKEGGRHAVSSELAVVISDRHGSVLAPMTILKYDHFPGCQKMSLADRIEGAPNFRQVSMPEAPTVPEDAHLSVSGVAMPMADAVKYVLERMNAAPGGARNVHWVSLREEPVAFVNGRPFVLRVVKDPIANIEMTGIISERVESMETRLKSDIISELKRYDQQLLLHEEEIGPDGYELVPVWETVADSDVASPADVYAEVMKHGYHISYTRIPITDEQAPIPAVFDHLFKLIWDLPPNTDLIFNCQMGRGRTTTGMIIGTMTYLIRYGINVEADRPPSPVDSVFQEDSHNRLYLNGEYKLILNLLSLLDHGKASKRFADMAIDMCAHVQNLREAIFNFKLRVEATTLASAGAIPSAEESRQLEATRICGLNYLARYFYLIVFSEFLMHRVEHKGTQSPACDTEFSTWLVDHKEISNLLDSVKAIDYS